MAEFRYCLNASTIRPVPLLEKIAIAAEAGYEGIELWHDEIDQFVAAGGRLDKILLAVNANGLEVTSTIALKNWFDTAGAAHTAALDECRRRFEQAAALDCPFVIATPPAGKADVARGAHHYAELLDIGEEFGVRPAMEFLGFVEQYNTIETALDVMQRSRHPSPTLVLDPFHIFRGGGSWETIGKLRPEQIAISHFNDAPADPPRERQNDGHRVQPGEGSLDLKRYLSLLSGIGYRGFLSLELFNEDLWKQDPREVAKDGLRRMRDIAASVD